MPFDAAAPSSPPAIVLDGRNRIVDAVGDLTPYVRYAAAAERAGIFAELRDDVAAEVREVVTRVRAEGRSASGLVVLLRDGPLACKPVVTLLGTDRTGYLNVAFETPLRAMASALYGRARNE